MKVYFSMCANFCRSCLLAIYFWEVHALYSRAFEPTQIFAVHIFTYLLLKCRRLCDTVVWFVECCGIQRSFIYLLCVCYLNTRNMLQCITMLMYLALFHILHDLFSVRFA